MSTRQTNQVYRPPHPVNKSHNSRRNALSVVVGIILISDPIVAQLQVSYSFSAGALSFLQLWRLTILGVLCAYVVVSHRFLNTTVPPSGKLLAMLVLGFLVFATKEFAENLRLSTSSMIAYGQAFYWAVLWYVVAIVRQRSQDRAFIGKCTLVQGVVLSVTIWAALIVGKTFTYTRYGISGSFGYYDSAKAVASSLVLLAIFSLYWYGRRRSRTYLILSVAFVLTALVTYNRAAQVSLISASAVLLGVSGLRGRLRLRRGMKGVTIWAISIIVIVTAYITVGAGSESLERRWRDVTLFDSGGSGRVRLWSVAWTEYRNLAIPEQVLGVGYSEMLDINEKNGLGRLHTHSDFFDLMLVGGVLGLGLLVARYRIAYLQFVKVHRSGTAEANSGLAMLVVLVVSSLLTGNFWATDFGLTFACAAGSVGLVEDSWQFRRSHGPRL